MPNSNFNANSIGPGNTPITDTSNQLSVQSGAATQGTPYVAPTSTSINSTSIAPSTALQLPSQPSINTGTSANASIPSPISTAQQIINQGSQNTPAETQQNSLLSQLATLTGQQSSLATQQYNQENTAGVPALTKTVNDLTTKLQGLSDQSTLLQSNASPGGLIDNTEQNNAQGRGITAAGLAPQTSADLRNNQIQQAGIAAQSLTVKSALYAAQGSYTLAKNAADQAAQVAFDAQTQQINYMKAAIAAIQPQLNKEEKAQADLQTAQLNDRQAQITQQQTDFKTGQAMAIAAMQNNPNDPAAQYAAQQAMQVSPNDPQYIQKVAGLVAQYQKDPIAAQQALATLANTRANTAKTLNDLNNSNNGNANPISALPQAQQQALQSNGFTKYNTETQGLAQQLATGNIAPGDLSKRATGTSPYNSILSAADAYSMATTGQHFNIAQAQRNYTFATNVNTQNTLNYLKSLVGTNDGSGTLVGGNLSALIDASNQRLIPSGSSNSFGGTGSSSFGSAGQGLPALNDTAQWAKLQTGNPQIAAYYATLTETSDQVAKILQGGGTGSGTSDAKLAQAQALFQKGFTPDQVSAVAGALQTLLTNRAKGIIGNNPYLSDYANALNISQNNTSQTTTVQSNGQTYQVGAVYNDGTSNWTVDAKGNWTKQ